MINLLLNRDSIYRDLTVTSMDVGAEPTGMYLRRVKIRLIVDILTWIKHQTNREPVYRDLTVTSMDAGAEPTGMYLRRVKIRYADSLYEFSARKV